MKLESEIHSLRQELKKVQRERDIVKKGADNIRKPMQEMADFRLQQLIEERVKRRADNAVFRQQIQALESQGATIPDALSPVPKMPLGLTVHSAKWWWKHLRRYFPQRYQHVQRMTGMTPKEMEALLVTPKESEEADPETILRQQGFPSPDKAAEEARCSALKQGMAEADASAAAERAREDVENWRSALDMMTA